MLSAQARVAVTNIRRRRVPVRDCEVYVGRANSRYGVAESPLANPFVLAKESERAQVVGRYREWLAAKVAAGDAAVVAELERLLGIARTRGRLELICWCAPRACHAGVIAEYLTGRLAGNA